MTHNGSGPTSSSADGGEARKMDLLDGKISFQNSATATTTQARKSWSVFDGRHYVGRIVWRLTPAAGPEASAGEHLRRMGTRARGDGCFEAVARGGHSVGIFNSKSEAALALKRRTVAPGGYPCLICGTHDCFNEECELEELRQVRRALA